MVQLSTIIFNEDGRFFKFKKNQEQYICDICYWKGILREQADGSWQAEILQKFDPFEHHQTDAPLATQEDAMRWVATRLTKK